MKTWKHIRQRKRNGRKEIEQVLACLAWVNVQRLEAHKLLTTK